MDHLQKVLWSEGMFLTPHHFQQWDRYYDRLLQVRMRSIQALDWGVCDLKINEDGVANGQFALAKCAAVMPDGLAVDIPDLDPLPETNRTELAAVVLLAVWRREQQRAGTFQASAGVTCDPCGGPCAWHEKTFFSPRLG